MVLGMNIFTAFFVLLLLLSKNVPSATDAIPLIGLYYCLNMVMIATSTVCCTVVVHIFFRGQDQVPWLLRKIFLEFLARIFCMRKPPVLPAPQPARSSNNPKTAQSTTIVSSLNNQSSHLLNNKLPASTAHLNPKPSNDFLIEISVKYYMLKSLINKVSGKMLKRLRPAYRKFGSQTI